MLESDRVATLLELARRELPSFFSVASAREIAWLDALVVARAALVIGVSQPRHTLSKDERMALERATDAREREFSELRDLVRQSPAFASMSPVEREKLSRVILDPPRSPA
jgi:hypothetical protein